MNAPGSASIRPNILDFFGRHLVAICVTYRVRSTGADDNAPRFAAYNGTLIDIKGAICFLTAGHVLADLQEKIGDSRIEILETVLADTFGLGRVTDHPIPFDLKSEPLHIFDDEDDGLDFGVIVLRPYYVGLLARNAVVALDEQRWIHQHRVTFDGYALLGLPQEFSSPRVSESGAGAVSPTIFRVVRLDAPPPDARPTRYPRFVGRIDKELPLSSIEGMSGGPIFGFRIGAETRYWIVALQSSWFPGSRTVFGCLLPTIASLLTQWAEP